MLRCSPHYVFPPPCPEYKLALLNHLPYLLGGTLKRIFPSLLHFNSPSPDRKDELNFRSSTAVSFSLDRRCSPSAEIDIAGRIRVKIWA
ncbi:hypothetical protein Bca52824_091215 [Brassica carinata]|uniref:Uncharacterized protein n=2 Tax=Brassica TaxID=3705 RepID=A0ABQ7EEM6_BRACR|nr:hypothetical protein DY000_02027126 [Brassica cretica]KAG2239984.1 hypothetical protein Bca52824_091215 [Brassica carinata]